ncbi:MAG TPA: TolC family protein [Prolixibacteraceae bacterium]|nr:TolC family protein [Prolixibacteraceae bacterium]
MKKFIILIAAGLFCLQGQAQEKWSLQKCIDYALANNIVIKQYQINTEYRENLLQQSKNDRLPDLSANVSQGFSFGRSLTIDNTYDNYTSANTGVSASTSMLLWRGGTLNHTIRQRDFELKSSLEDLQKAKDDITLSIASGYLEILFAKELLKVAEAQVEQTLQQIERTRSLIEAGKVAEGALLEIQSQKAREELDVVNRQNNLQIAYLNLAQILELEDYTQFDIEIPQLPELKAQAGMASAVSVYQNAVEKRPEIKSAGYQLQSFESQLKVAEGSLLPSLSFSAGFYDQYLNTTQADVPGFIDQITDNHRESVGLNLNIPIFSRFQNKTNIANAKLQMKNQELQLEGAKKDLRRQIEQAYTNALAALNRFNASQVAVKSMQESFRYIEEKFNVGRVTSVEYNDAKTKLAVAESDRIQAKYDFIFRSKILDFYNGIPIEL